ncbi:acyl-CoA dehydrogenase family protein [Tahibacter amnicola]|uniref:Acyl-CoA dehydrogenase family protein n=1 Tax=Tahibacter amnicola TaxID=2976241 RepID=A0ABY6BHJ4_9GAMM|nr:acyl-CoA dehydrogenase family protein [Tahibacter amnicola]UXI69344.1 acyl-CoA dehydrogenase family protein [Tahibacter amnicola]
MTLSLASTTHAQDLLERVRRFVRDRIQPAEGAYFAHVADPARRWTIPDVIESLKSEARADGLWNLFLPGPDHGAGLNNRDYAPLAECMGRSPLAPEVFNCNAPDTGNMEVLMQYGSAEQQARWLEPLLDGRIRSAFAMTEPAVASSDATNIATRIVRDGDDYRVDGRKWWTTGAMDPRCAFFIVMGVTQPQAAPHERHSMILVPRDTPGVTLVRPLTVFGYDDAPHGHAEVLFDNVRVPAANLILGEGRGFEIAQGRLGPGRIHHCMRLIGLAQRALETLVDRAQTRIAFGKPLAAQGVVAQAVAESHCAIEQARLLTLSAAETLDRLGNKAARDAIGMIKIVAPRMACEVIDRAIQVHGAAGLSDDTFLAHAYAAARALRLADGPDEVHVAALARSLFKRGGRVPA